MQEEIEFIKKNQTWKLTKLPSNKKPTTLKWIYKSKINPQDIVVRQKARLVAKGFLQQTGVNYGEVFSPIARIETIRLVVSLTTKFHWSLHQLDVKSTFLNNKLDEEVYVVQPQGFEIKEHQNKVYRLRKALYGLKQAPRT